MIYAYTMIAIGLLIVLVMAPRWYQNHKNAKIASELLQRQLEEDGQIRKSYAREKTSLGTGFFGFLTGVFVVEFFRESFRLNKRGKR